MDSVPQGAARAADASAGLVVVPRTPGPLVNVDDLTLGRRDEVDDLVRELFGDPIEDKPGPLDVVLVILGGGLIVWSLLVDHSGAILILGVIVLLLGLALPLSSARRSFNRRRAAARKQRLIDAGWPLDTTHPAVVHLVGAYEDLSAAASTPDAVDGWAALAAGHEAMTEVASLLRGRRPAVPSEIDYINKRTSAMLELKRAMLKRHDELLQERITDADAQRANEAAVALASRKMLAEISYGDSVDDLARVTERVRKQADHADA